MFVCKLFAFFLAAINISIFFVANVDGKIKWKFLHPGASSSSGSQNAGNIADILSLSDDLQQECFDYLSLEELISMGETNRQLSRVANEFFGNYFHSRVWCRGENIYLGYSNIKLDFFRESVQRICVQGCDLKMFQPNQFQSLREIEFFTGELINTDYAKNILTNVETLKFIDIDRLNDDLYETFLQHCELKRLYVKDQNSNGVLIGKSNDWLTKPYSSLIHFEVSSKYKIDGVIDFLKLNRNIRKFSTTLDFLLTNTDSLLQSGLNLDILSIFHANLFLRDSQITLYLNLLNELKEKGFFEHLHLYLGHKKFHSSLSFLPHLLSHVKLLHIANYRECYDVLPLINLEKLYVSNSEIISNFTNVIPTLQNLEYVSFDCDNFSNILIFITNLPKLRQLQIRDMQDSNHSFFENSVLNLLAINKEREELSNAMKLTMYIPRGIYMNTKRSLKSTRFSLIEIQRFESYDGDHDFASHFGSPTYILA